MRPHNGGLSIPITFLKKKEINNNNNKQNAHARTTKYVV